MSQLINDIVGLLGNTRFADSLSIINSYANNDSIMQVSTAIKNITWSSTIVVVVFFIKGRNYCIIYRQNTVYKFCQLICRHLRSWNALLMTIIIPVTVISAAIYYTGPIYTLRYKRAIISFVWREQDTEMGFLSAVLIRTAEAKVGANFLP